MRRSRSSADIYLSGYNRRAPSGACFSVSALLRFELEKDATATLAAAHLKFARPSGHPRYPTNKFGS